MSATEPYHADHLAWMGLALDEARLALKTDDVPIGAVVLGGPDGGGCWVPDATNGKRSETRPPTPRWWPFARPLLRCVSALTMRVPMETAGGLRTALWWSPLNPAPCVPGGRLSWLVFPRVVFGAWDEKAGAVGSVFDILRERRLNHWVEVYAGIREEECAALLRGFFATHRVP